MNIREFSSYTGSGNECLGETSLPNFSLSLPLPLRNDMGVTVGCSYITVIENLLYDDLKVIRKWLAANKLSLYLSNTNKVLSPCP